MALPSYLDPNSITKQNALSGPGATATPTPTTVSPKTIGSTVLGTGTPAKAPATPQPTVSGPLDMLKSGNI